MPEATKPLAAANLRLGVTIGQALFQGGWIASGGGGEAGEVAVVTSCGLRQRLSATPEQGHQ